MLHRALDVVFQHMFRLIAVVVVVPLGVGIVGLVLDHSSTVEVRIWADRPLYSPTFATDRFNSADTPADIESGLLRELIGTTSFSTKVLTAADPLYSSMSADQQERALANLQQDVVVSTEGVHLFTVSYKTLDTNRGRALVQAVITAFGNEVQTIDSNQLATVQRSLQSQADSALADMNDAVKQVQTYQVQHGSGLNDPEYQTLVAQAKSKTGRYLAIKGQLDDVRGTQSAVPQPSAIFHVVDQPYVVPFKLERRAPAVKYAAFGLIGVLSAEALLVYMLARRDPGIRSVQDVRLAGGFKPLGSAPVLGRHR